MEKRSFQGPAVGRGEPPTYWSAGILCMPYTTQMKIHIQAKLFRAFIPVLCNLQKRQYIVSESKHSYCVERWGVMKILIENWDSSIGSLKSTAVRSLHGKKFKVKEIK
ncbi:hypothetical protein TNCV_1994731 [Trichonephila clavipes]|nr:hypothetical protein TNCV_1994731 [Trichonephila clavipes]